MRAHYCFLVLFAFSVATAILAADAETSAETAAPSSNAEPGTYFLSLRRANDTVLHLPPQVKAAQYSEEKIPVLVGLHGMGENFPSNFQRETAFDETADRLGAATLYPLGSPSVAPSLTGHTWNAGACCLSVEDDESFLVSVLQNITQLVPGADPSRV
uniref:Feruloyl esterase n=1 Tax=Chromera velia CCMP2878 TaxID=1169474 RepID=A0A0G4HPM0_9ALVE|mmetsp:Transcript_49012/g.96657  ORF Transcript_49012/g.96657 Transcript_49012/m.96657 type:complete len:158 (-) Transcript_49012:602-1075(-)|eukprot:Cvel_7801.t1-p1 / transcript=Cvel_7801.t1 / gene=Cvel_7801 / organism=Chromera_velia_CCMP2878 / gene_product=hypothetical protein / transcript_product=hypothetical protein / location=Cvel_scaffold416:19987-20457(+) / protein_length=157 / sequence_SO=supercontig / SO=protein_coding / is_pseudo=false